jgi:hypothetical protein
LRTADDRRQRRNPERRLPQLDKAIADDIDLARDYVHIEYFILVHDDTTQPVFDALRRACQRGVIVRVLSDHMAQFAYPNRKETVKTLTDMVRSAIRCCRSGPSGGSCAGLICGTTARSW